MMMTRLGRKKPRVGIGPPRPPHEPGGTGVRGKAFQALLVAGALVVIAAAITKPPQSTRGKIDYDIDSHPIALEDVRSDTLFQAEDLQATKEKREEAALKAPDTYRVDGERVRGQLLKLQERVDMLAVKREQVGTAICEALSASDSSQTEFDVVWTAVTDYAAKLREDPAFEGFSSADSLAVWLLPVLDTVPKRSFEEPPGSVEDREDAPQDSAARPVAGLSEEEAATFEPAYVGDLSRMAREALEYVLRDGVIKPAVSEDSAKRTVLILREELIEGQNVSEELPAKEVITPGKAPESLNALLADAAKALAPEETEGPIDWAKLRDAAFEMTKPFIADTLSSDAVYTEAARERARLEVEPVLIEIQPGEAIQHSGDRWTAQSRSNAKTYWKVLQGERKPVWRMLATLAAHMILSALVILCLIRAISLLTPKREERRRNFNLALLLICATLVLGRIAYYVEPSGLMLPSAAAAILLAILINARVGLVAGFLIPALVSAQFNYDWRLLVVGAAMSVAGVFAIREVRRRNDLTKAAIEAAVAGIVMMVAVTLATDSLLSSGPALRRLMLVALNGCICIFVIPGALPPLEKLFGITTDIQLLEYSDFNNEILSRMAIEAPATYSHSLMLGQLAEAAAAAIGANGLLARVCAYYHDIGKLRRPEYFSENQTGPNIHDDLTPRTSARAIAAHVTRGAKLAREYRLPKPIVDAILEHHGTCLISFFYDQALEQKKHGDVRRKDFRYPGPKPQSRETAILMICDAVESGVRSIKNPNEERVREFIDKIIQGRAGDRQFDECDLTLKDLDTIKGVVTRLMATASHTRIAYPEKKTASSTANVVPITRGTQ